MKKTMEKAESRRKDRSANLGGSGLKRMFAGLLAVMMTAGVCTSCGTQSADTDENGRTVISVGGWPTSTASNYERMETQKAEFEAENPDVIIEPDTWSFDLQTFYPKAEAGMLPTVYYTNFTEIPKIIDGGYSADLTDVLNQRGYEGKFDSKIEELVSEDGRIYAFPYAAHVMGLAYNTEMLAAAGLMSEDGTPMQPQNWQEAAEFAVRIKEATGKPGMMFPTSNNVGGWIFTCLAWSFGVDFMEQDENGQWQATFNTPECVEALEYIKSLKWTYDVLPANTLIDLDEYYRTFATGGAGMMIAAGDYPRFVTAYDMIPDQVGIMALPAGPERHVTLLGGGLAPIAQDSTEKQIDAAIRWLEKRGYGHELTESAKASMEDTIESELEQNQLVGIKGISVWNQDTDIVNYRNSLIDKYANSNPNHVKLYNEFVLDSDVELQAEEPVCAQDLYGVLDNCIQEVLSNPDADCAALIEDANSDFQTNFLNNVDY